MPRDILSLDVGTTAFKLAVYTTGLEQKCELTRRYDVIIDTEQYHCFSGLVAGATRAPLRVGFATNARRRLFSVRLEYSQELYEVHSFHSLVAAATGRQPEWDPDASFYPLSPSALTFAAEMLRPLAGRQFF